jgi:glycosyltransferase involved in cell wall biosynthesis
MRIAISGLVTPPRLAGVGQYVAGLLGGMAALDHDDQITVYVGTDCPEEILAVVDDRIRFVRVRLRHDPRLLMRPLYLAWQQVRPQASSADVLHVPNLVPARRRRIATVTSLHDLAEWHVPDKYPPVRRAYRRMAARAIVRWSDRVLVPTVASRDDLVASLEIDPASVVVAPFGVDGRFRRPPPRSVVATTLREVPMPYLLYVGSDLSHKNLDRMVQAAARVLPARGTHLVLAGVPPASTRLAGTDRRWVHGIGYVDSDQLIALYRAATGLVFPSLLEGFGLPVVEAFAAGCPVLTSAGTACAEVAGEAAVLVDPTDVGAIASGMLRLLDDGELRQRLVVDGFARAESFTWTGCAELTREAYRAAIVSHRLRTNLTRRHTPGRQ